MYNMYKIPCHNPSPVTLFPVSVTDRQYPSLRFRCNLSLHSNRLQTVNFKTQVLNCKSLDYVTNVCNSLQEESAEAR